MHKIFIIDTSVLLHDPLAILRFANNEVVIPLSVLEELDNLKKSPGEKGSNARSVLRFLDSLKTKKPGDLQEGVQLEEGPLLKIFLDIHKDPAIAFPLPLDRQSNKTLLVAFLMQKKSKKRVVFVSKDFVSRVKAEAMGIEAEDYESLKTSYEHLPKNIRKFTIEKKDIDLFFKEGRISSEKLFALSVDQTNLNKTSFDKATLDKANLNLSTPANLTSPERAFFPNEYCLLTSIERSSAICRYNAKTTFLESISLFDRGIWGIKPLNVEQKCVFDLLLDDKIKLVSLIGPAGTGKTLLALACGLQKVLDESVYSRILVSRPIMPLGKDIGYLPGTKEEKLFHWMQPIYDNLEFLCQTSHGEGNGKTTMQWIQDSKKIEMEAVTYIRGRTLPDLYIIIDEAQNLTPHEIKTIISRAGLNTKVILTGDPTQIDNPYLDQDSNGLTYVVNAFRNQSIHGYVFLEKTERSELAKIATKIM